MTLKPTDLEKGMDKIANKIFDHCENGKQSEAFKVNGALACGQFYGDEVKNRIQCGLHGTAAAVFILLRNQNQEKIETAKKLLKFIKDSKSLPQYSDDQINTIKQAEVLGAINDLADDPQLMQQLKEELLSKQDSSNGAWSYFYDDNNPSEIATCYALLALNGKVSSDSKQLQKALNYIWKGQSDLLTKSKSYDIYAIAIRSLMLYTLAKCDKSKSTLDFSAKNLNDAIKDLWDICRSQYKSDFEVNVEYHRNDKNIYIRIPWQIYLAHAILLADPSNFYSIKLQKYLSVLNKAATDGGYRYAHAGEFLSSRTNAILYGFLDTANKLNPHMSFRYNIMDGFYEAWSKTYIRVGIIFDFGLVFLSLSNDYKDLIGEQSPFWSDFIGALVISGLSWLYSVGRR